MPQESDLREVFGNQDTDPIALGIRVGNLVHLTRITGVDENGATGDGIERQMALVHQNLRSAVESAGGSIDNVAQVSFFVKDRQHLQAINPPWVELFPSDTDRPTYKFMAADLPGDLLVQAEAFAVLGARRELLHIPGVAHTNPIPMGVKIGGMVFSSRILPFDPATGAAPEGFERQVECVFQNLRAFLDVAKAEPSAVTQARVFIHDKKDMPLIDHHWAGLFGTGVQPVQHVVTYGAGTRLQAYIEIIARL